MKSTLWLIDPFRLRNRSSCPIRERDRVSCKTIDLVSDWDKIRCRSIKNQNLMRSRVLDGHKRQSRHLQQMTKIIINSVLLPAFKGLVLSEIPAKTLLVVVRGQIAHCLSTQRLSSKNCRPLVRLLDKSTGRLWTLFPRKPPRFPFITSQWLTSKNPKSRARENLWFWKTRNYWAN